MENVTNEQLQKQINDLKEAGRGTLLVIGALTIVSGIALYLGAMGNARSVGILRGLEAGARINEMVRMANEQP